MPASTRKTQKARKPTPDLLATLTNDSEIRGRIRRARKEAGLTQKELAVLLHCNARSIQNYERHHVPWRRVDAIAEVLNVTPDWILHGEPPTPVSRLDQIERQLQGLQGMVEQVLSAIRNGISRDR